jgi:GTPase SAR1 family protein
MKVPGTTMDISLKANGIHAVDQGVIKRIKYAGRTFVDVLEEIQRFAYLRGYNTPTSILKFIIKRIGLPDVEVFPLEDDLTKDDLLDLSRALNVVETLKDEYLSPLGTAEITEDLKEGLTIKTPGSQRTDSEQALTKQTLWNEVPQSEEAEELIYSFHWENLPVNTPTPRIKASSQRRKKKKFVWDDTATMDSLELASDEEPTKFDDTPHELKVLVLGEQQVGVKSILFECNLKQDKEHISKDASPYLESVYRDVVEHDDCLVDINAWTFEITKTQHIPRSEFYTGAGVAVIVYSVAERWSFDSLEFWAKELTSTFLVPPPIIIVGNKIDLRSHPVYDEEAEFEEPVTTQEGEVFSMNLAKELGENGEPHPLVFLEVSSVTGKGITELLDTIIDIWLSNERPSMPAMESSVIKR